MSIRSFRICTGFFFLLGTPHAISTAAFPPLTAEEAYRQSTSELEEFDRGLPLRERKIVRSTPANERVNLPPSLRKISDQRRHLLEKHLYWETVVDLKKDLLQLPFEPSASSGLSVRGRTSEADQIARTAITAFEELRRQYKMIRPAPLHNILVNSGLKKEGFCWHWTRDLRKRIQKLPLRNYDFLWATAREGTTREHNTLVLIPRGGSLQNGLLLDGWRRSGKPFWTQVAGDKYPWRLGEYAGEVTE